MQSSSDVGPQVSESETTSRSDESATTVRPTDPQPSLQTPSTSKRGFHLRNHRDSALRQKLLKYLGDGRLLCRAFDSSTRGWPLDGRDPCELCLKSTTSGGSVEILYLEEGRSPRVLVHSDCVRGQCFGLGMPDPLDAPPSDSTNGQLTEATSMPADSIREFGGERVEITSLSPATHSLAVEYIPATDINYINHEELEDEAFFSHVHGHPPADEGDAWRQKSHWSKEALPELSTYYVSEKSDDSGFKCGCHGAACSRRVYFTSGPKHRILAEREKSTGQLVRVIISSHFRARKHSEHRTALLRELSSEPPTIGAHSFQTLAGNAAVNNPNDCELCLKSIQSTSASNVSVIRAGMEWFQVHTACLDERTSPVDVEKVADPLDAGRRGSKTTPKE